VQTLTFNGEGYSAPRNLRLSWYRDQYSAIPKAIPPLTVGQTWQFTVRLKPPHGFMSPGASDYSQHLFSQHIDAVGHVYTKMSPVLLSEEINWRDWVNKQREMLWHKLQNVLLEEPQSGIIAALALGERAGITTEEWKILQATGTSHLVAISGLHVGLVAGLVMGVMSLICRYLGQITERFPARISACVIALVFALIYSALAGFAVPTQRALIMLALVMYGIMQRRSTARIYILITAAVIILLYDPLATLSVSFWLSFIAIGAIFYIMQGRQTVPEEKKRQKWREWGRLQWGISCLLIPITLWYFQQAPLVSPIANAIAIPWVSFIVVPLTLFGCVFLYVWPVLGELLLQLATYALQAVWQLLQWFALWPYATWEFSIASIWIYVCLILGALILFMPRGMPGKFYGVCALLPIWLLYPTRPLSGEVWVDVLDVGQGLAVVVRTAQHNLVFDTGDVFSDRLDAASAVILPFLRREGIDTVDTLIVSHNDRDHRGGAETLLQALRVKSVYAGENWQANGVTTQTCKAGQRWHWDDVEFKILHPDKQKKWEGNNASCVLKVSSGAQSILITGDIESPAENYLVKNYPDDLPTSILIAGHHGSATSSSKRFLQQVDPEYVVFAAGYLNRFKFPNPKVAARYLERGVVSLITGTRGTIHLEFDAEKVAKPTTYLESYRRYWHRN
jgi:competence protein ComEC